MIEENFLIFKAPKECITWPCAWIHPLDGNTNVYKGPIKISYNKKIVTYNAGHLIILIAITLTIKI